MAGRLLVLLLLVGCRQKSQTEIDCLANAKSVTPSLCYARARAEAYTVGYDAAWAGYGDGYDQCEADHDTGDTGGDTAR